MAMGKIEVKREATIGVAVEELWQVVSGGFTDVEAWASLVNWSKPNPQAIEMLDGAPAGGRICDVPGFGRTDERIIRFDVESHTIGYGVIADKIPSFVSNVQNIWNLREAGPETTHVSLHLTADVRGIRGAAMGPMMKSRFGKAIDRSIEDLRVYAETGDVSEHKRRRQDKLGA
jgi:hypothetical protein